MASAIPGAYCILFVPGVVGFWIGWVMRGRRARNEVESPIREVRTVLGGKPFDAWLVDELDSEPMRTVLTDIQRGLLRGHYAQVDAPSSAGLPETVLAVGTILLSWKERFQNVFGQAREEMG